jgi:acetyl esterase/lipase
MLRRRRRLADVKRFVAYHSMKRLLFFFFLALPVFAQNAQLPQPPAARPAPDANKVRARYNALVKRLNAGQVPADSQNFALLLFKVEQARLWILQASDARNPWPEDSLLAADDSLARAEVVALAKGDAVFPAATQEHERAYVAPNDGSVQPFWVYVPKNYSPKKQYPLVVFLHGYSPDISKVSPWLPDEATWSLMTDRGFIFAVPYGRRNSDFVGIGEDDTIMVTEAVKARYSVDPNRVFLMGTSMGGFGAYAVGLHQPDIWAGLTPMSGRTDFSMWFDVEYAKMPSWKRLLYQANEPMHLAANAANLPIFLQHGERDDLIDPEQSRRFYKTAKEAGNPVRYREIAGAGHYIYFDPETYVTALEWAAKVTRNPAPKKISYITADLRNNRSYWATIEAFSDYNKSARLDAEIKGSTVEVRAENIARFSLLPPAALLKPGQPLTLIVNGAADARRFEAGQPLIWPEAAPTPVEAFPGVKSPRRPGPIENCYRDSFLLVYGTLQEKPANATPAAPNTENENGPPGDRAQALRFAQEWAIYADGFPRMKADKDVSAEDRKNHNLILFGTRESNSILAEIADKLPLELLPNGYRIGQKRVDVERPEEIGLQFCYPSPFDARRMVVVQSGLFWGEHLPPNHKLDLLPDYIVFDNTIEPGAQINHRFDTADQTNRALEAGFFDGNWQLKIVDEP